MTVHSSMIAVPDWEITFDTGQYRRSSCLRGASSSSLALVEQFTAAMSRYGWVTASEYDVENAYLYLGD